MTPVRLQGRALTRRTLLRGALRGGAVAVGLPWLECLVGGGRGDARACGSAIPVRFGLFFWGNGNRPERWRPTGTGDQWELSEELGALANVKSRLDVLTGFDVKTPNTYVHASGAAGLLTGAPFVDDTFALPTLDQIIADAIGTDTLYKSVQTGVMPGTLGLSYTGPWAVNPPELSPYAFYERLFGSTFRTPGEPAPVDPTLGLRQSALDAVLADLTTLRGRVGAADRARLEQHMDGVRELERRLARLQEEAQQLDACVPPGAPAVAYPDVDGRPQYTAINHAMCDLLVMALACDQTRVFGHYFSDPVSDPLFPGATGGHHDLTHTEAEDQPQVNAITGQIITEFAYLLERMQDLDEAGEPLLDHCVVLGASETSLGLTHAAEDMPLLLAGGGCGRLRTGLHVQGGSENVSKVMLSVIRAVGVDQADFGADEGYVTEGCGEIEV